MQQNPRSRSLALAAGFLLATLLSSYLLATPAESVYPSWQVGTTNLDRQFVGNMGRQIVLGGGYVHFGWAHFISAFEYKKIHFKSYNRADWSDSTTNHDVFPEFANYPMDSPVLEFDPTFEGNGRALLAFDIPTPRQLALALDSGLAQAKFGISTYPTGPGNCEGTVTGTQEAYYGWPKVAIDLDAGGNPIAHIIATEWLTTTTRLSLVYRKTTPGLSDMAATCVSFVDSVHSLSGCVVQDPNSQKVAIAYTAPDFENVYYRQSTDLGNTWAPPVNVSHYAAAAKDQAYNEVNALYTSDGCLHIVWPSELYDWQAKKYLDEQCRVEHWDDCRQCISQLYYADNYQTCRAADAELNVSKITLTECSVDGESRLYATYTYYNGDDGNDPFPPDCSNYPNGEIYMQVSEDQGQTWGAPNNLTLTQSPGCASGYCWSEVMPSTMQYANDSILVQYLIDKQSGFSSQVGAATNNPIIHMSVPCFGTSSSYGASLTTLSPLIRVFFNGTASYYDSPLFLVRNDGNQPIQFQLNAPAWIEFPGHPTNNGIVGTGCLYRDTVIARVYEPPGLAIAESGLLSVESESGPGIPISASASVLAVHKPIYPDSSTILSTPAISLAVTPVGRIACQAPAHRLQYSDGQQFLYDASPIIGNSATELSWSIFGSGPSAPSVDNPFGQLLPLSGLEIDSSSSFYTRATSLATNRDSTIGYTLTYYLPKFVDSSEFVLLRFEVYKGLNNPTGVINDLIVAYSCDWDIPATIGFDNKYVGSGYNGFVQTGQYSDPNTLYGGALAAILDSCGVGGTDAFVWKNETFLYPFGNFENDSLWKYMASTAWPNPASGNDLSTVVVAARNLTIDGSAADTFVCTFVISVSKSGQAAANLIKGKTLLCNYVIDSCYCAPPVTPCICGDADNTGIFTISDAVFLIGYIFAGGAAPARPCLGDADGNNLITISDAVYLIGYIFAGGPVPHCP